MSGGPGSTALLEKAPASPETRTSYSPEAEESIRPPCTLVIFGASGDLTRRLLAGLCAIPGVRVLGPTDTSDRRGVVTFTVEGCSAEQVCRHLDRFGVALRGGHHCAQPLIRAFGVEGAARASLAPYSQTGDVDALLEGLDGLARSAQRLPDPSLAAR